MDNIAIDVVNFDHICRLCMNAKRSLVDVFATVAEGALDIPTKLKDCADVEAYEDDGLPKKICLKCIGCLNAAYDFKKQCQSADSVLKGVLKAANSSSEHFDSWSDEENAATKAPVVRTKPEFNYFESDDDNTPLYSLFQTSLREKRVWMKRKPRKTYTCETCQKIFNTINTLAKHNVKYHGAAAEEGELVHKCEQCDQRFRTWNERLDHEKQIGHAGRVECKFCKKKFVRSYVAIHESLHSGERNLNCSICRKSFYGQAAYDRHLMRCTKAEKQFQCSYCGRQFYRSCHLRDHVRIHTMEKPHVCQICKKGFRRRAKLKMHEDMHNDVRPYLCTKCGRGFRQSQHMKEHMRIHTGIRPYVCDVCNAAFTQGHCLKTHKLKHAME